MSARIFAAAILGEYQPAHARAFLKACSESECLKASGHKHNEQAASDYKTAAQKDSVVWDLLEENKGNHLRHYEENCDVDSHQTVEIKTTFVDHETVREQS